MNLTAILILGGITLLVLLAVAFGLWSFAQRLKVRKYWKSYAAAHGAKYSGGIISHPMLELDAGGFDCRLILAKYKNRPDRVVVHMTVSTLPAEFAAGSVGASHAVGRFIAGKQAAESLPIEHVCRGWSLRGNDALELQRIASDRGFEQGMRGLAGFDPQASVEWGLIKYTTEDYPTDDVGMLTLIDIGLSVAVPLTRLTK